MLYPYMKLGDGTEILHTQIIEKDGVETVEVHFEKPIETGFKTARCILPSYEWIIKQNYSDEEIAFFTEFLEHNIKLIFESARAGGVENAEYF